MQTANFIATERIPWATLVYCAATVALQLNKEIMEEK